MKINGEIKIGNTNKSLNDLLPVVLYDNQSGALNNVPLSEMIGNFKYVDVYYGWCDSNGFEFGISHQRVDIAVARTEPINLSQSIVGLGWQCVVWSKWHFGFTVSNNKLIKDEEYAFNQANNGFAYNYIKIRKIVGYK